MTTLSVEIDAQSKRKYRLNSERFGSQELKERILLLEGLNALHRANKVATKHGLSKMPLKAIEKEIAAERNVSACS